MIGNFVRRLFWRIFPTSGPLIAPIVSILAIPFFSGHLPLARFDPSTPKIPRIPAESGPKQAQDPLLKFHLRPIPLLVYLYI